MYPGCSMPGCDEYSSHEVNGRHLCSVCFAGFLTDRKLELWDELVAAMEQCIESRSCGCEWCVMSRALLARAKELNDDR